MAQLNNPGDFLVASTSKVNISIKKASLYEIYNAICRGKVQWLEQMLAFYDVIPDEVVMDKTSSLLVSIYDWGRGNFACGNWLDLDLKNSYNSEFEHNKYVLFAFEERPLGIGKGYVILDIKKEINVFCTQSYWLLKEKK